MLNKAEAMSESDKEMLKLLRLKVRELLFESKPSERRVYVRDSRGKIRPTRMGGRK